MKNTFGYARFAFYVLALPLLATAAVSAHQYLLDNTPVKTAASSVVERAVSGLTGSFRNHTLSVNDQGSVSGRVSVVNRDQSVSGLSSLRVCLVRDGQVAHVVDSNSLGQFEFTGVEEGIYSFVATGKDGFAACGVKVVRGNGSNAMEVAVVNPDFKQVREIFESTSAATETLTSAAAEQPARIEGNNRVATSDGNLVGKLFDFVSGSVSSQTKAYLVRNNQRVAEAPVDAFGQFSFAGVEPGVYEFVAAGPTGYAAVSFEAVAQEGQAAQATETVVGESVVEEGAAVAAAQQLDVPMTAAGDHAVVNEQLSHACDSCTAGAPVVEPYAGAMVGNDIACGAAAGGCCNAAGDWGGYYGGYGGAGGGYGGGAGGLIGLGRLAVLGWVLTELFNNVDWNGNEPPPVSPST